MKIVLPLLFVLFLAGCENPCGNTVFKVVNSPNEKFKVVIFERSCGAITGFSTQISVINAESELENDSGNVFIANGHPRENKPRVRWITDQELQITFKNVNQIAKMEESISGFKISFKSI